MIRQRARVAGAGLVVAGACLGSCHDGGSGSSATHGAVTISATDAASDGIASFSVPVLGLRLVRGDGTVAAVVDEPHEIDFAALAGRGRVLAIASLPKGEYVRASLILDLGSARCFLAGRPDAAQLLDRDGEPFEGAVTIPVDLGAAPLRVIGGRNRVLAVGLDLDASLAIDSEANRALLEPVLVVRVDPPKAKELVAAGRVAALAPGPQRVGLAIDALHGGLAAEIDADASGGTVYELDGLCFQGSAGFAMLPRLEPGALVRAYGEIDRERGEIDLRALEGGTGTAGNGLDVVEGYVVRRIDFERSVLLTVRGSSYDAGTGETGFGGSFKVYANLGGTRATSYGSNEPVEALDVAVGQRVQAFGTLDAPWLDTTSKGVLRFVPSALSGYVEAAPSGGALTLLVERIGPWPLDVYDFGEPASELSVGAEIGTLAAGHAIDAGTPLRLEGRFVPAGPGEPSFVARALERAQHLLMVRDRPGAMTLEVVAREASIEIVVEGDTGPNEVAALDHGFAGKAPVPRGEPVTIAAAAPVTVAVLRELATGESRHYLTIEELAEALRRQLLHGGAVAHLSANGRWDETTRTLAATSIAIVVH